MVADLVSGLLRQGQRGLAGGAITAGDMGVIATYRRQVHLCYSCIIAAL